ncbi:ComEA family DNA-binding protein, partial [Nocardioides sp.]|uniref:ComEA family DNA-binding protein n=1 Tax=Nocardioides sp. TaxID=35761 RepID=UPI002D1FADD3
LALTCWWLLRTEPRPVPPAAQAVRTGPGWPQPSPAGPVGAPSAAVSPSVEVVVDVAGKVRRPGIVVLEAGARVVDALQAAGGARPGVDLSSVNLARLLVDGEQILVGGAGPAPTPAPGQPVPGAPAALVDLNTADQTQLESLPEVGPVTAQAIIGWREEHGGFTSVDQLLDVDGIGEATLSRIAPLVTL